MTKTPKRGIMHPNKAVTQIKKGERLAPKVTIRGINVAKVMRGALRMAETPEAIFFLSI